MQPFILVGGALQKGLDQTDWVGPSMVTTLALLLTVSISSGTTSSLRLPLRPNFSPRQQKFLLSLRLTSSALTLLPICEGFSQISEGTAKASVGI